MFQNPLTKTTLAAVTVSSAILTAPVLADEVSAKGDLRIQYSNNCYIGKVSATYRVHNGSSGVLIPLNCSGADAEASIPHKFVDTSGKERCVGRMTSIFGYNWSTTRWEIDGSVPGYFCSTVGKTFNVKVKYVP